MTTFGFHYYPDTLHYTQRDLNAWLPILNSLKASWLVLLAPPTRAIPEHFISSLLEAGIQPVLDFQLPPDQIATPEDMTFLYKIYAKWGVKYINMFKKPNMRDSWDATNWAQTDLVERYLDIFLPHAESCLRLGMIPIFSPLEPGGDYWDTAFLRAAMEGIRRRAYPGLVSKMVIGAVARAGEHSLNWGAGGPERWPGARPYFTPQHQQDQRGFRIFDWYNAYVQAVLITPRPIFLFEMGPPAREDDSFETHTQVNLAIARILAGKPVDGVEPLPNNIIGGAFWLLATAIENPQSYQAWYQTPQDPRPIVAALEMDDKDSSQDASESEASPFPISHYLLLPTYDGEILDIHFEMIRPFVKKHHPTIGFSIQEARQAGRVTVLGGPGTYPDDEISKLRTAGCIVQQIDGTGMDFASL